MNFQKINKIIFLFIIFSLFYNNVFGTAFFDKTKLSPLDSIDDARIKTLTDYLKNNKKVAIFIQSVEYHTLTYKEKSDTLQYFLINNIAGQVKMTFAEIKTIKENILLKEEIEAYTEFIKAANDSIVKNGSISILTFVNLMDDLSNNISDTTMRKMLYNNKETLMKTYIEIDANQSDIKNLQTLLDSNKPLKRKEKRKIKRKIKELKGKNTALNKETKNLRRNLLAANREKNNNLNSNVDKSFKIFLYLKSNPTVPVDIIECNKNSECIIYAADIHHFTIYFEKKSIVNQEYLLILGNSNDLKPETYNIEQRDGKITRKNLFYGFLPGKYYISILSKRKTTVLTKDVEFQIN